MTTAGITEQDFLKIYGAVEVGVPPSNMSLSQAVALEAILCPVAKERRSDPETRLAWMASKVGEHLLPEHAYLIAEG